LSPENAFIPSILDPGAGVDPVTFEPVDITTGTPATCGFQAFPGFRPESAVQAGRDSFAVYADAETDLTDRFLLGLAARFEDFGNVGSELTGKVSARYEFSDQFAIRGAVQTGFRAPSLQQLSLEFVTTTVGAGGLTETLLARTGSEFPGFFGIDSLDIETSTGLSAGFVWEPLDNVTITVDGYRIEIDDRIVLGAPLAPFQLDAVPAAQAFLVDNLISQANFFSNAIDTETTGVGIVASHDGDFLRGSLTSTLAVDLNETSIDSINAPPGVDPDLLFPDPSRRFIETGQPQTRLNLSFDWERDRLNSILRLNYIGETETSFFTEQGLGIPEEAPFNNERSLKPGSALLVDLEFGYRITENLQIAVGGNNLLDEEPDKLAPDSVIAGITRGNLQFPMRGLAYGLNGGFYYARFNVNF
jgi:iron complex outermembrane receptor protein